MKTKFYFLFIRKFLPTVMLLGLSCLSAESVHGQEAVTPTGTKPLTMEGDLSAQMVQGIDKFLMREIENSVAARQQFWQRDYSSKEAYDKSVQPNREHLRKIIGAIDPRAPVTALEFISTTEEVAKVAETELFRVYAVRWPVLEGVYGEGLLLDPKGKVTARIVAIPDADQTPEMLAGMADGIAPDSQFARRLAENGCQVLVPTLVNRQDTWSGSERLHRFTNQPHREWLYRQSYELGRHIIGYEVQKVLAAVDWFAQESEKNKTTIGVAGYGEGGLIAFYSAALDTRIDATLVSGYFGPRQRVWEEPIYRNVFGLLAEFGDAEIASLIAPRQLLVEYSEVPKVSGPPKPQQGRSGAAPGQLITPEFSAVEAECERAKALCGSKFSTAIHFLYGNEGTTTPMGSYRALSDLLKNLGVAREKLVTTDQVATDLRKAFRTDERQKRQVTELERFTQRQLQLCEATRDEFFWNKIKPTTPDDWAKSMRDYQTNLWSDVLGKFAPASLPANPRLRKIHDQPLWTGYEVVLDVWPDVYAWGYLQVPKNLKPGEHRPVVVCQHGLEGVPEDVITEDPKNKAISYYHGFAARLADQGFVTFAPHNPYRGQDNFRVLQRKANPLGKSLFSIILAQHERILDWLSEQPFVDPQRIAFYGLSYGGKSAMRLPALLNRYCLSICSGDFNEWIWKNATVDWRSSYLFSGEYEMPEFNLGQTFNYAEMAALIAPRPFMVERGHNDGVGLDERVAYEYAKVRRLYDQLGIGDRTAIEFFNGPHTIRGVGTFDFLHQHLNWPGGK